jgi:rRNA maturation endonuclease Nob1
MGKRLALGCCPNCNTALPEEPRSECRVCGLQIGSGKAQDEDDRPVVVRMKAVWR